MKLAEYLKRVKADGVTQAIFAEKIGVSVASVSRIAAGLQKPDFDTLRAIEKATDGKVLACDLEPSSEAAA